MPARRVETATLVATAVMTRPIHIYIHEIINENILIYSHNMSIYILSARIETATQVATVVSTRPVCIHLHLYAWKHTWECIDRFTSEINIHIGNVYVEIHHHRQYLCPPKIRRTWACRRSSLSHFDTMYYVLLFCKYNISYTALWRINKALSYKEVSCQKIFFDIPVIAIAHLEYTHLRSIPFAPRCNEKGIYICDECRNGSVAMCCNALQ